MSEWVQGGIGKFSVNRIHLREKSQRTSERDISDLSAKDEGNDAHRTDLPCLRERCLVTDVQIAAYVNMIWHTMMMLTYVYVYVGYVLCGHYSGVYPQFQG